MRRGAGRRCARCARSPRSMYEQTSAARGLGARLLAEVDAAGELAHDEQVGALDPLAAQRRGVVERGQRLDGAQVGVQAEPLAQPEQPLLGARRVRGRSCPTSGRRPRRAARRRRCGRRRAPRRSARCRARRSRRRRRACSSNSKSPTARSSSSVGAMISGPIPSPGSVTMRCGTGANATQRGPLHGCPSAL